MEELLAKIDAAGERVRRHVVRTPLLESEILNDRLGFRLLVKAESLQKTGSFKVRGALNFLSLASAGRQSSFVTFSSGNHAQGLAYAARAFGSRATVFMPTSAPARKIERTKALGADVQLLENFFEERQSRVEELVSAGACFVPPFDHEAIIAGQGTVGIEIAAQVADLSAQPDLLVAPISGGGLFAGAATALRHRFPDCALLAVEPSSYDDFSRSVTAGQRVANDHPAAPTICDGLMSPTPGRLTFEIVQRLNSSFATVTDADCSAAVKLLFEYFNIVAEPSGAASLAALVAQSARHQQKTAVVIVSGGNVDTALFSDILNVPTAKRRQTEKDNTP